MPNKTIDQKLDDILSDLIIVKGDLNSLKSSVISIQSSINSLPGALTVDSFHLLLGGALNKYSNVVKTRSGGGFDFQFLLPFYSLGLNPVLLYLSEEFRALLNYDLHRS